MSDAPCEQSTDVLVSARVSACIKVLSEHTCKYDREYYFEIEFFVSKCSLCLSCGLCVL